MSWFGVGMTALAVYVCWAAYRMVACMRWRKNMKVGDRARFRSLAGMTEVTVTKLLDDGRVRVKYCGTVLSSEQTFERKALYGGWRI